MNTAGKKMNTLDTKVKFIRGFADRTRLQILDYLLNGEKSVSQIVEAVKGNQSNISQHLSCLKNCDIVAARQEGKYIYYSIKGEQIKALLHLFNVALEPVEEAVACCETTEELTMSEGIQRG